MTKLRASLALACAACFAVSNAAAQELSVRPTLFAGESHDALDTLEGGLQLGLTGRTTEFGAGFTLEADVSVLAVGTDREPREQPAPGNSQFNQFFDRFYDVGTRFDLLDNSSFARVAWRPDGWNTGDGLALTVLPLHADRIYLGYAFPAVIGLAPQSTDLSPGARLKLQRASWYAFAAMKSPTAPGDGRAFTVLAGGGVEIASDVRLEAEGGHADAAAVFPTAQPTLPTGTWAFAARVTFHHGEEIGPPTDFRRYAADPAKWENLLRPPRESEEFAYSIAADALYLSRDQLSGGYVIRPAPPDSNVTSGAYALEGRIAWRSTRAYLRAQARSQEYLFLQSNPGASLDSSLEGHLELSATATVDHQFKALGLTPGASFEVVRPAFIGPRDSASGYRTVALLPDGSWFIEPGTEVHPLYVAELTVRWDWRWLSLVAEGAYQYDVNTADAPPDTSIPGVVWPAREPATYDVDLFAQARF